MIDQFTLGMPDFLAFGAPDPAIAPPPMQPVAPSGIYAFGDSLSDAGNDYIATDGLIPTSLIYSDGRFSNGNVWVQDLAADLNLPAVTPSLDGGTDYAYGGAETGQDPLHTVNPTDLPSQLVQFLANVGGAPSAALYTLSIGANDVIDAIGAYAGNPGEATSDVRTAVSNEVDFVKSLALDGARDFVILNVPNLGKTPGESSDKATATKLSKMYDTMLSKALTTLATRDGLSMHLVDTYTLIDEAVAHPQDFGLTNVKTPVWTGNYENPFSGTLNATGAAQNTYLFFDHLHPTETGHTAIANLAYDMLK